VSDRDVREGVRTRNDRRGRERDRSVRWSVRVLLYGGGQVALFGFPILWLVYRGSRYMVPTRTGASVALLAVPVAIGTLRAARVDFPRLDTAMLATYRGNRAYLRRAALVNATLALAAYGGGGVGVVTAVVRDISIDAAAAVLTAAAAATVPAVGLVAAFGTLGGSSRAVRARMVIHGVAVALLLVVAVPTPTPLGAAAVVVYGALAVADVALGIRAHGL